MSNHKFKTHIGDEVEVEVEFDYSPAEVETRYYPGCAEEVDVCSVEIEGDCTKDILEILSDPVIKALEVECFEHLNSMSDANEPD